MTALKSLLFFLLVPGLLVGYFPYRMSTADREVFQPGVPGWLAFPLWGIAAAMMVWCFLDFTFRGRGTPAPTDPPKELVAAGLYRFVRNPMYVSGILALAGWAFWSPSLPLILAPFLFFAATHTFVTLYEEPTLRVKFGSAYEEYLKRVPRWIPRIRK
jgi:protein-S-isoprenylcysteine O-methyltransferase Ste14